MMKVTKRASALLRCLLVAMIMGLLMGKSVTDGSRASTAVAAQLSPTATATATPDTCRDIFEDDGVPAQARQIVLGETQSHIFCPAGDADWVTFFAKGAKAYSIETSGLSIGVDTYLNLFAPDGRTLLATNDDAVGSRGVSRLLFYPQSDGWYLVQAKNQGDIGGAGFHYSLGLKQADLPTGTPTPTPPKAPTLQATSSMAPTTAPAQPTQTPFGADLLHPQKGDGGVDVFEAGPQDALQPDGMEANDSRESARPINVGAVYKHLNFVPPAEGTGAVDADFFTFRAKPGLCYLVQTGDLSSGLDTTILLWRAVQAKNPKEIWKLAAQNDDAHPRTPDLGSAVRWCVPADSQVVLEIRNYGGQVVTDPRGKSYSLSLVIDPPTPTPTRVPPTPVPAQPVAGAAPQRPSSTIGGPVQAVQVPAAPLSQQPQPTPTPVARAIATPSFTPTAVRSATPVATSPTVPPASATPVPEVSVDVVAYVGDQLSTGPNPGDGIVDLPVLLVDVRTNAVIQQTNTDHNGHAQLTWQWQGPVRVAMPAFRWGRTLQLTDFTAGAYGSTTGAVGRPGGGLLLMARMSTYSLPGIYP